MHKPSQCLSLFEMNMTGVKKTHTRLVCGVTRDWKNQLQQASRSPELHMRGSDPVRVSVCVNVTKGKGESKTGSRAGDSLTSEAS